MKSFAIILNICLIFLLIYRLMFEGLPVKSDEQLFVFILFLVPTANLIAFFKSNGTQKRGLISLYLERKRLEEQQQIDKIRGESGKVEENGENF